MDSKAQITALYERMYRAMIEKDTAALRPMFADDFYLVHMTGCTSREQNGACSSYAEAQPAVTEGTGTRQNRQQYLDAIADGTLNYYSCQTEQLEVNIDGDSATLTGRSRVLAAVYGGGKHTWRLQLTFKLRKQDGLWQFTYSTASTY